MTVYKKLQMFYYANIFDAVTDNDVVNMKFMN